MKSIYKWMRLEVRSGESRRGKRRIIFLAMTALFLLAGCISGTEQSREISNPMREVEGKQEFEKVGVYIEVPAGAQDARYYIVNDEIAEIQFTFNGAKYSYRSSGETEDLTGLSEELEPDRTVEENRGEKLKAEISVGAQGAQLAQWEREGNYFSLYTEDEVESEVFDSLCKELVGDSRS